MPKHSFYCRGPAFFIFLFAVLLTYTGVASAQTLGADAQGAGGFQLNQEQIQQVRQTSILRHIDTLRQAVQLRDTRLRQSNLTEQQIRDIQQSFTRSVEQAKFEQAALEAAIQPVAPPLCVPQPCPAPSAVACGQPVLNNCGIVCSNAAGAVFGVSCPAGNTCQNNTCVAPSCQRGVTNLFGLLCPSLTCYTGRCIGNASETRICNQVNCSQCGLQDRAPNCLPPPPPPPPAAVSAPFNFGITPQPAPVSVIRGQSAAITFNIVEVPAVTPDASSPTSFRINPYTGPAVPINLSVSGCPPGATCSVAQKIIRIPPTVGVQVAVATTQATPMAPSLTRLPYRITLSGSGGGLTKLGSIPLSVNAPPPPPPVLAAKCGNNTIESGEQCDGTNLGGQTCASLNPDRPAGTLVCSNCRFDTSRCVSAPRVLTCYTGECVRGLAVTRTCDRARCEDCRLRSAPPVCPAACISRTVAQSCTPNNFNCGTVPDGCGGSLSCGFCAAGQICVSNHCVVSVIQPPVPAAPAPTGIVTTVTNAVTSAARTLTNTAFNIGNTIGNTFRNFLNIGR